MRDETWINGKDVGGTSFSNKAEHMVAAGVLRAGTNVIVSNIFCSWRNCGFRGPDENRVLRLADSGTVVLNNPWRYKQMSEKDDIIAPQIPWGPTHGVTMDYNGMIAPIQGLTASRRRSGTRADPISISPSITAPPWAP